MDDDTSTPPDSAEGASPRPGNAGLGRRGLVGGLALGGAALGAGVAGGAVARRGGGGGGVRRLTLSVDVACLGATWREAAKGNASDAADFRTPFMVEGWIYPAGTIKGDGFIPVEDGSIGRWFCRGYSLTDASREQPHACTHQDHIFGTIRPDDLFPVDQISNAGIEGTTSRTQVMTRAVIGGTGRYLGATGQVHQQFIAWNTSYFPNSTEPSFSFRFDFDLRVLD